MMLTVLRAALVLICLVQATLETVHYVHMFQLHSYRPERYRKWMTDDDKRTLPSYRVIFSGIPLAVMMMFGFDGMTEIVITAVAACLCLIAAILERPKSAKKPLVVTPRAKRLFATLAAINAVLIALIWVLPLVMKPLYPLLFGERDLGALTVSRTLPAMLLLIVLMPVLFVQLAGRINAPIEKHIANGFIDDAKRRLAQRPDLTVIGITGSYGKTSVKHYLTALLSVKYQVLMTPESYNTPMGVVRTIRERLEPSHEIFVCEMGARNRGDIREICDIVHPHHGVVTAVGEQHLETFQTMKAVTDTKFELIEALPEDGIAFLNTDNEYIASRDVRGVKVVSYGLCDGATYTATDVIADENGSRFKVVAPDGDICEFTTQLLGEHSIQNLMGCIAVANQLGITLKGLQGPVSQLKPVPHRLQLLPDGYIDDTYNSNPVGFRTALDLLGKMQGARRVLITPGMVELGERQAYLNEQLGAYAASHCDWAILVGEQQAPPLKKGLVSQGFDEEHIFVAMDLHQALSFVKALPPVERQIVLLENDLPDTF